MDVREESEYRLSGSFFATFMQRTQSSWITFLAMAGFHFGYSVASQRPNTNFIQQTIGIRTGARLLPEMARKAIQLGFFSYHNHVSLPRMSLLVFDLKVSAHLPSSTLKKFEVRFLQTY